MTSPVLDRGLRALGARPRPHTRTRTQRRSIRARGTDFALIGLLLSLAVPSAAVTGMLLARRPAGWPLAVLLVGGLAAGLAIFIGYILLTPLSDRPERPRSW